MTHDAHSPASILIVGAGGREHALAWRCAHEGHDVLCVPGSAGIALDVACAPTPAGGHEGLIALAHQRRADLVVVGPEQPLVDGLADTLREAGIATVGPGRAAAALEGSKADAKAFMVRHGIPTARHVTVRSLAEGLAALDAFATPPVVKADGLAAGKGVTVAADRGEAEAALRACLEGDAFGAAGRTVVLEERLQGAEASYFVLTDGEGFVTFAAAQDHKRIFDGDRGPNTGGMGAYAPAPLVDARVDAAVRAQIVEPTLAGLRAEGRPFVGVLFVGLMIADDGTPSVIEYNVRFGDPEVQPLLWGLDGELVPALLAAARGELRGSPRAGERLAATAAATVVLAAAGYPGSPRKGDPITGLAAAAALPGVKLFHAGTASDGAGGFITAGGRVLGVCARGPDVAAAVRRAYAAVDHVQFEGRQVRRDIGARAG